MTVKNYALLLLVVASAAVVLLALPRFGDADGVGPRHAMSISAAGAARLTTDADAATPPAAGTDADAAPGVGAIPTALCADHYFSYSHARSGICGIHGGVLVWLSAGPHDPGDLAPTPTTGPAPTPFPLDSIPAGTDPDAPPYAGAFPTALCADGWFSYSHAASGICALHGGVVVWFTSGPHDPLDAAPTPTPTPLPFGGSNSS